jgi:hypothetical protein
VHYDSSFWKTIKYLCFKPGYLTVRFLQGARKQFVDPVKLYIFISFISFLLITFFTKKQQLDSSKEVEDSGIYIAKFETKVNTLHQMDSLQQNASNKLSKIELMTFSKIVKAGSFNRFKERFYQSLSQNFPKALFLYLPNFAFFMWLFHNKKKWWYFEHGIFTLHYFSFLLIAATLHTTLTYIESFDISIISIISSLSIFVLGLYTFLYFFIAHYRVFQSTKTSTVLKGILLFIVNLFFLGGTFALLVFYTLYSI